jgi:hypothetical protein
MIIPLEIILIIILIIILFIKPKNIKKYIDNPIGKSISVIIVGVSSHFFGLTCSILTCLLYILLMDIDSI